MIIEKNKIYCPICSNTKTNKLELHSYSYYKCSSCDHTFCEDSERICTERIKKYFKSFYKRESMFVQNIPTKKYFDYYTGINSIKYDLFCKNTGAILDCNKYISTNSLLEESFGSSFDTNHLLYFSNNNKVKESIFDFESIFFDTVVCFDFLEYSYCLLDTIVFLKSIKKVNSNFYIILNIGNDTRKNYKSRIHEFSKESSFLFADKIKAKSKDFIKADTLLLSC